MVMLAHAQSGHAKTLLTERNWSVVNRWLVVLGILLYFILALGSLVDDSPTMDEQNHIARGIAFLRTGDPRLSIEHPPLINAISALPLLTMPELRLPTDHPSWARETHIGWYEFARLFMWEYNHDVERVVFLARLPIVFLQLGLAAAGYVFSRRLWGSRLAGTLALWLLLFEPNLLAHGRYSTTDMGGVVTSFVATALLWRLWQRPGHWDWRLWVAVVVAMGLTFSSKLVTIAFVPVWLLLALLPVYPSRPRGEAPLTTVRPLLMRAAQVLLASAASLVVVWAVFGFEWRSFRFSSHVLKPLDAFSGPMPTFWAGIEAALNLGVGGRGQTFLLGQFSYDGFLSYFPVAMLTKTPAVLLPAMLLAAAVLLALVPTRRRALFLLVTWGGYFGIMSVNALNIGYRHALPALPYLLVLVAGLASAEASRLGRTRLGPSVVLLPRAAAIAAATFTMVVAMVTFPHYLSYFNVPAGGMERGYHILVDSNVDWGQDLLRLRQWMDENEVDSVKLGWFGSADPALYGIAYEPLPGFGRDPFFPLWWAVPFNRDQPEPGVYAISATNLWEMPLRVEEKTVYAYFRGREPDAMIGGSILIYVVP